MLSLELLHNKPVLGMAMRVLSGQDPFMKLVYAHKFGGKGAFLLKAAARTADILGLPSLIPDRRYASVQVSRDEHIKIVASIRKADTEMLLKEHMSKNLHTVFFKHVRDDGLSPDLTFSFLKSAGLKSKTEGFVLACQDSVINTLAYQHMITGAVESTDCTVCHAHSETLMHVLSASPSLAGSSYISRHNAALCVLYYHLRHVYGIDPIPMLPYAPDDIESVVENSKCRIYWNYAFPTARLLSATKPDIILLDKENKQMFVIELSCSAESNISRKENEKRSKYLDLLSEAISGIQN